MNLMENAKPFFDLRVNERIKETFAEFARKYVEFGYKTIAIDHVIDISEQNFGQKRSRKKLADLNVIPEPTDGNKLLKQAGCEDLGLTVLNRITVIAKDKESLLNLAKTENFHKYHIFAVLAKSSEVTQFASDILDVDILGFDALDPKNTIKMKAYKQLISRGTHLEISYYPAIIDQTLRRAIIANSHWYYQIGKSRNIIITSDCTNVLTTRDPYDVINMGAVFGLNRAQAKQAITYASANVLRHALSRKIGKATVFIADAFREENRVWESAEEDELMQPTQKKIKTI